MEEKSYLDKLIGDDGFRADVNLPPLTFLYLGVAVFGSTLAAIIVAKALTKK